MTTRLIRYLLLAGTAVPVGAQAQTTGTVAGTIITNTATASYSVNGTSNTVSSNTASFVVDRKVNLTVIVDQSGTTKVTPGQQGAVAKFKVTNNTNGVQDFLLFARQPLEFPLGLLSGTDDFNVDAIKAVMDDGDGVYDPAKDTQTWIDELAPDTSRTVFIVGDVPNLTTQRQADVGLEVAVAAGGATGTKGALLIPTDLNLLDRDAELDVVFADNDNDGLLGPDLVRNGRAWAYASFEQLASSLDIRVAKTSSVISDGVSVGNPKALPGALVQYCLTITNGTALSTATNLSLTDVVPAGTTYVPGSISVGGLGVGGACLTSGVPIADNGSTTGLYGGSYNASTRTVTATIPSLIGGTSVAASFRVTVN